MPKGKFIVFEGADDLGKTTQIKKVYNYLKNKGLNITNTREPGGTIIGSKIRNILLETDVKLPKESELLLFMADRNIHYHELIKPSLEQGKIVLCDRFHLSTMVYQIHLKRNNPQLTEAIHREVVDGLKPDLTFVFHGNRLTNNKKDAYEKNLGDNTHKIINNYYYEYGNKLENHILIDANRDEDIIFNEIISKIYGMGMGNASL